MVKIKFVFNKTGETWYVARTNGSAKSINLALKRFLSRFGDLDLFAEKINLSSAEYLKFINTEIGCTVVLTPNFKIEV